MTAAGRFRCCQCCRGGEDPEYHTEHGADSHEIPCPTCEVSPRLRAQVEHLTAGRDELAARLAAVEALVVDGEASDGHHTHNELYEYRMLYNAHAAHGWRAAGIRVVKSWRHSDGEECFGGGWFIVVATLPTGQVSNHYKAEHWDLFQVPEVDLPPEYDGHTPADAAARLRAALAAAPTDTTKEN